jgi:hypothetical protein
MPALAAPNARSWSVGDIVSGALLNANLRDGMGFLKSVPVCRAFNSSTQTLANVAWTPLSLDTTVVDTYNATGARGAAITVNGATLTAATPQNVGAAVTGAISSLQPDDVVYLNAGDHVQALGVQSSDGTLSTTANGCSLAVW